MSDRKTNTNGQNELISIKLIRWFVCVYDIISLPVYHVIQQPWKVRQLVHRKRSKQINDNTWINVDNDVKKVDVSTVTTLDELFRQSVERYATKSCLGYRKILAIEKPAPTSSSTTNRSGPPIQAKYVLDDNYTWLTYSEVNSIVQKLSVGLLHLPGESPFGNISDEKRTISSEQNGHQLSSTDLIDKRIIIVADTCMNWFLIAHACFRINVTVVTAYTTLDDAAILHTINETEARTIVVSQKFSSRLQKLLQNAQFIHTVIILDDPLPGERDATHSIQREITQSSNGETRTINVTNFNEILTKGEQYMNEASQINKGPIEHEKPQANNIAVLMYTSGSTGLAKGVMLSHSNIVYTAMSFSGPGELNSNDRYIAYLPLGHVLELAAECVILHNGATIAYSSHLTLTDRSPAIKLGQLGDTTLFRPTVVAAVPLILERMKLQIQSAIESRGEFARQLFDFVIQYKRHWYGRCYTTPIMNYLLCRPFRKILGGKVRAICCGGAALPKDTHEYLKHIMDTIIIQGYGSTESSAAATICDVDDIRYNVVGSPMLMVEIKLENWDDYRVTDKPYPRGEIIIGGPPVSMGYYKLEQQTQESFYIDPETKTRYFRTGDIGQMFPDGVLQIIDRKKDIVKPLSGEYISLVQVELVLKTSPIVDNICVNCNSFSNYLVALVVPNINELIKVVYQLIDDDKLSPDEISRNSDKLNGQISNGINNDTMEDSHSESSSDSSNNVKKSKKIKKSDIDIERACNNSIVVETILEMLKKTALAKGLKRSNIPAKIKIVTDEWTAENGLITASFKLRRRQIEQFYSEDLKQMYQSMK